MFLGSKVRLAREADNLTAICEPIVWTMWDPQHLTILQACTASYKDSFTFFIFSGIRKTNSDNNNHGNASRVKLCNLISVRAPAIHMSEGFFWYTPCVAGRMVIVLA
jgi:hypothetical protein